MRFLQMRLSLEALVAQIRFQIVFLTYFYICLESPVRSMGQIHTNGFPKISVSQVSILPSFSLSVGQYGYCLLTQLMDLVGICMVDVILMSSGSFALDTILGNDIIRCCYGNTICLS